MKKFFALSLIITFVAYSFAQESNIGGLRLTPYVPQQIEHISPTVSHNLENKLLKIVNDYGLAGTGFDSRFILAANIEVVTKDITSTAPAMFVYNFDISFFIGDGIDGKMFSSYSIPIKGVGENETKAYLSAFRNIKTKDPAFGTFIQSGKQKIIDYYNQNVDQIIKHAQQLASISAYDEALTALFEIPDVCTDAYNRASTHIASIYQQKINYEGETLYNEAYTLWNSTLDYDGAVESCNILSQISPLSSASPKANSLSDKIAKRVKEIDSREWNFKLQQQKNEADITKALINAAAEVAKAEANRPVYNYNVLWW